MNILPMSVVESGGMREKEWDDLLGGADDGDWCIFTLDVQNTYGLPFEVTLTFDSTSKDMSILIPSSRN